jgi:hypothetical protein
MEYTLLDGPDDCTAHGLPQLWGVLVNLEDTHGWGILTAAVLHSIVSLTFTCSRLRVHRVPHTFRGAGALVGAIEGSPFDTLDCRFACEAGDAGGEQGAFLFVRRG